MKRFKNLLILICSGLCCFVPNYSYAQNNYSYAAINLYNSGVACQRKDLYDAAEQKYIQALKLQPDFVEAKKNLAMVYYSKAQKYYGKEDYNNTILYAQKALSSNPKDQEYYYIIANSYARLNDYAKAIPIYNKLLNTMQNDNTIMNNLAIAYIKTNQYEKSYAIYQKILTLDPKDKIAQININYIKSQQSEQKLTNAIQNATAKEKAPKKIYRLIKVSKELSPSYKENMKSVLDLIWSEPTGKLLLSTMSKKRIYIKIVDSANKAETMHKTETHYETYGLIPVGTYSVYKTYVNIPIRYIDNWNNTSLSANERIYNLDVFVHEFGHAFMFAKYPKNEDSIEEEFGVTMIGYNIAYKIITGEYLTQEEIREKSPRILESIFSDEHRNLPLYSGFNNKISACGIYLPYPQEYSNLGTMYRKLVADGKIAPVNTINPYVR